MANAQGILVTRPSDFAQGLCDRIETLGWHAIRCPLIAIEPTPATPLETGNYDLIIFISRNAVIHGLPRIVDIRQMPVAAVGKSTANELTKHRVKVDLMPANRWDSEGLLALPELALPEGKRILIVRGEGGRALLGDELRRRGAVVDYAEVYRRSLPPADKGALLRQWQSIQLILATSNETLDNLFALLGEEAAPLLRDKVLICVSERGERHAQSLGLRRIIRAEGASDDALIRAMIQWAESANLGSTQPITKA